jgi:putative transposase
MDATLKLEPVNAVGPLCDALGLSTATFYRRRAVASRKRAAPTQMLLPIKLSPTRGLVSRAVPGQDDQTATAPSLTAERGTDITPARNDAEPSAPVVTTGKQISHRALSTAECSRVLAALNEDRFCNLAPAEVFATLLDEGTYMCSERTMYRILAAHAQLRERRNQLRHPAYTAPELMATAPNQLWSWDITKLKTFVKCRYFHLYVILDVYSRYVVGWRVEERESGELAKDLMETTCERQQIQPGILSMHADNGPAMISQHVASLLIALDVAKSHSRPHVSDDNPFSEAQFKTLKYRPTFPERFASLQHAREFLREFFAWYNTEHHHSGLALLTPHDVHHGLVDERLGQRAQVLDAAYAANPERFVRCPPAPRRPPATVWINPPKDPTTTEETRA